MPIRKKSDHKRNKSDQNKAVYDAVKEEERKRSTDRITYLEIISQHLSLPPELLAGAPVMKIHGRDSLCIENYKRILEYQSNVIKIQTRIFVVTVEGSDLKIAYYTKDEMHITGIFHSICYT